MFFVKKKKGTLKVATTRAELHKIQYKSIQVVADGIGLENYLIRNVSALLVKYLKTSKF